MCSCNVNIYEQQQWCWVLWCHNVGWWNWVLFSLFVYCTWNTDKWINSTTKACWPSLILLYWWNFINVNRNEKHDWYYGGNNNAVFSIITAVDERKCKYNFTWINLTSFTFIKIRLLCQLTTLLQSAKLNHCCSHIDVIQKMWANSLSIAFVFC